MEILEFCFLPDNAMKSSLLSVLSLNSLKNHCSGSSNPTAIKVKTRNKTENSEVET